MLKGVVLHRGLHEAGEEGGLASGKFACGLGEVKLGGGFDTVGDGAEGSDVQVASEDLILVHLLFDGEGVLDFAKLTFSGLLGCGLDLVGIAFHIALFSQSITHVLLGNGRCALLTAIITEVIDHCAGNTRGVNTVVFEEASVFNGDDCLLHDGCDFVRGDNNALLIVETGNHLAVRIEHRGLGRGGDDLDVGWDLIEDLHPRLRCDCTGSDGRH